MQNIILQRTFIVIAGLMLGIYPTEAKLTIGDPAPKLQVAKWVQGDPVQEFDTNHIYIVEFWATWCGPCVGEIPHIKEAYEQFHSKGFEVVGINFDSNWDSGKQKLKRFVEKEKMPWPQYFDGKGWDNKFGIRYGIRGIPEMWLVDKNGDLRETNAGDGLNGKIKKLFTE